MAGLPGEGGLVPEDDDEFAFVESDPEIVRERLAAIVRSADDAIFSKNVEGIVTSWNAAAERLYGYSAEEMIGRPISIVIPTERAGEDLEILRLVVSGKDVDHYETQRVTRDGRIIDVSISASPLHDSAGETVGAAVIARDITAVIAARGLQDRLAAIVEGSEDAIYSKNRDGIVDTWNPAAERLYGYSEQEVIGRHIRLLVPLDLKGEETEILNRILAGERIEHFETQRVTKSGDLVNVSISVSPVHDEREKVIGASVIGRDIEARTRLEHLQNSLDRTELIARVVHDLRTPLTSVLGLTTILAGDVPLPDDKRRAAHEAVVRQGERLTSLIDDLLDLSYLESGRYQLDVRPVEVSDVVKDALETAPPADENKVTIDISDESLVMADFGRLGQVLVNLLTNAYKYGGDRITIGARPVQDHVVIEVSDNGPGIPEEIRDTLFEPFTRGRRDVPGSGLGLTITHRLIKAQGGEIRLGDRGIGSCFVIELPRARTVEEPAS
jgi:PAS domain S-box-containing protein